MAMHRESGNMPHYQQQTMATSQPTVHNNHSTFANQNRFNMGQPRQHYQQQQQQQHLHPQMMGPSHCQMQQFAGATPVQGYPPPQSMLVRPPVSNVNVPAATSMQQNYPSGSNATVVNNQQAVMQQQSGQVQQQQHQQMPQHVTNQHEQPSYAQTSPSNVNRGSYEEAAFSQQQQQMQRQRHYQEQQQEQQQQQQQQQHRRGSNSQEEFHQVTRQETTLPASEESGTSAKETPDYPSNEMAPSSENTSGSASCNNDSAKDIPCERRESSTPGEIGGSPAVSISNSRPSIESKDEPVRDLEDEADDEAKLNLISKEHESDDDDVNTIQAKSGVEDDDLLSLKDTETAEEEEEEIAAQMSDSSKVPVEISSDADAQNIQPPKVLVPTGWRRLALSDAVIYYSPSGIQIKSMEEAKSYLLTDGTCKCGLECPMDINKSFDFDIKVRHILLLFYTGRYS